MLKKTYLLSLALLSLFFLKAKVTQAANANLSVSPPVNYLSIKPGESKEFTIRVENLGPETLEVSPVLLDFDADNKTGQPVVKKTGTFPYLKINGTLSASAEKFNLEPKQRQSLPITIEIPPNAGEEEYAMTIFFNFRATNSTQTKPNEAKIEGMIGSNLILLITRNTSDRGILQLKHITALPTIDSFMPIRFGALVENIGKNATPASGSATIYDWRGSQVATFEIQPDMVLAGSSRELRDKNTVLNTFVHKKPFLFGLYKIKIELNQSSAADATKINLEKTILALPFIILLLPLISLTAYYGYRLLLQKFKAKT